MRRGPTRELISLGLVGVGPAWERRYRSAVKRLSHRLCIRVIHDPVLGRAQLAAQECGAEAVAGLKQVFCHPGVHGILVLDASWYGFTPLEFACASQRPTFLAGNLSSPSKDWWQWHAAAQERGVMFVPELAWRFQPSTARLRELIASRLGPVQHLHVRIRIPPGSPSDLVTHALAGGIDWCGCLSRQTPHRFLTVTDRKDPVSSFQLAFRPDLRGNQLQPADFELVTDAPSHEDHPQLQALVTCESGEASVEGPTTIRWKTWQSPECEEHLDQERAEEEVMLDQFCRRLVGGLIPTATFEDVAVALDQLAMLAE